MKKLLILAAIMVVAWTCVVTAQEQQPRLKPNVSPKSTPTRTRLLLEIAYNRTLPPAYSVVGGPEEKPKWIWLTRFTRIPGRNIPPPPIQAVRLESVYNGETADVKVTLLRGTGGHEQEDLIGVYHVGLGEHKTVSELEQVGIEPFTITLTNTVPPLPPPPTFQNATKSIEIASVQSENVPTPGYRVVLRNLSDKKVLAVKVQIFNDGRPGVMTAWQGEEGHPLINPGAVAERYIPAGKTVKTATGYTLGVPGSSMIALQSALFEDMSFEGDPAPACLFESYQMGRRLWLKHVVPLLDQESSKVNSDHIETAKQFREKFLALDYVVEPSERDRASSVAATCAKPSALVHISVRNMRLQLLRELDEIINTRPAPPVNFKSWLQEKRAVFSAWLARL